jgi:hypothetical protein
METIQSAILAMRIYALAITIAGQAECLRAVKCRETRTRILLAKANAENERNRMERRLEAIRRGNGITAVQV